MNKYVFIDSRIRDFELEQLRGMGYKVILLKKQDHVYPEISAHADIFMIKINNFLFIEEKMYSSLLKDILFNEFLENARGKINIIKVPEVGDKYPEDIKLNIAIVGGRAFHNLKYTDKNLIEYVDNCKFIDVKQGYTNCSTAIIDENSIITNDKGIYEACKKEDIDSLFINVDDGEIKLLKDDGSYSDMRGFIGGCISRIGDSVIIFGDIKKLNDYEKIFEFMRKKNIKIISFKGEDLIDYGGLIEIEL